MLSMPAAELFATWATAEAAIVCKPATAVIAVGDCDPAAGAIDAASSGVAAVSELLTAMRARIKFWLGVSVPREWNLDADRLEEVLADARAAGLAPIVVEVPEWCWAVLRAATERARAA